MMSLLTRIRTCVRSAEGGDPADAVPEPVQQPDLVLREHVRVLARTVVQQALLRGGLVRPRGAPGHGQQRPG